MLPERLPVAILAGGLATRMRPFTQSVPKLLLEVAGEPFFNHQLRLLRGQGLTKLVLCVGHLGEQIVDHYGDGSKYGVEITYSFDGPELRGTGGAITRALPMLGNAFYVLYGDSYLPIDFLEVGRYFLKQDKPALMTVYRNHDAYDTSNVWFENGGIQLYSKTDRRPQMQHIDYGLSLFHSSVFAGPTHDAAIDLAQIQSDLSRRNALAGYEVHTRFYEIGSISGLHELDEHLRTQSHPL